MYEILEKIQKIGIVPVVVLNDANDARPLAQALCKGGLPCAEVTFRTDAAEESIKIMTAEFPGMLVGAGTVLTIEQAERAMNAGAKFIVSPDLNPKVVQFCLGKDMPLIPGVSNPAGIGQALELGLEAVKFFPAEQAGGLNMIKAMSAPFPMMKFIPTGGINAQNLNEYLGFPKILACGGSWMVKGELVKNGEFEKITKLTKEAVLAMLGFELKHIGVNCKDEEDAGNTAGTFARMFGLEYREGNSSVFAGTILEAMKAPYLGANGHIAIGTNNVARAINYLEMQGVEFDMSTAKYNGDDLTAVYMKQEIGGFAVHLVQK